MMLQRESFNPDSPDRSPRRSYHAITRPLSLGAEHGAHVGGSFLVQPLCAVASGTAWAAWPECDQVKNLRFHAGNHRARQVGRHASYSRAVHTVGWRANMRFMAMIGTSPSNAMPSMIAVWHEASVARTPTPRWADEPVHVTDDLWPEARP